MSEILKYCFQEEQIIKNKRGKDIFKGKIKYIIQKYYQDQPIYAPYFNRYGSYQRIRIILEDLVKENYLIKFKKARPVYYLVKELKFMTADKINYNQL